MNETSRESRSAQTPVSEARPQQTKAGSPLKFHSFPELKELQQTELEILGAFVDVCEAHKLRYHLDYGTLLGAIRHKGFIPWDDDIDVGMPREDYERFLEIGQAAIGDRFFLQTRQTDPNCPFAFLKIRKNQTTCLEWSKRRIRMHHGIWIDVFPYDKLPISDAETKRRYMEDCVRLERKLVLATVPDRVQQPSFSPKWFLGFVLRRLAHYRARQTSNLAHLDQEMAEAFTRYRDEAGEGLSYTSHFNAAPYEFPAEVLYGSSGDASTEVEFEGRLYRAPADPDAYLRIFYGDYWQLPPEAKRVGHRPARISFTTGYAPR